MILLRVLHAEMLKLKRTIALKMVVIAPAAVVLLTFWMAVVAPFSTINRNGVSGQWTALERGNLRFWGFLMMPLYIALQTALLAGIDHADNQWKSLCARPVPRWTFYLAKLIVALGMNVSSALILSLGVVLSGVILPHVQPELVFRRPIPVGAILEDTGMVMALAIAALVIQHWVSLRWRSFSVAVGVGIVATISGIFATAAGQQAGGMPVWPHYFPWALPMLVQAPRHPNLGSVLLISAAASIVIVAVGCAEFARREIQ